MLIYFSFVAQIITIGLMGFIAVYDAKHLKIRNAAVLLLLLLYLPAQGFLGFPTWSDDLLAGGLLFVLGFVMWLARALGAGDAKLMLPLGMHMGYLGLAPFAVILTVFSVLFYLAITLAALKSPSSGVLGWLAGMKTKGRMPYAIPLCVASVPVLLLRVYWTLGS